MIFCFLTFFLGFFGLSKLGVSGGITMEGSVAVDVGVSDTLPMLFSFVFVSVSFSLFWFCFYYPQASGDLVSPICMVFLKGP